MDQHQEAEIARGLRLGQPEAWRSLYDAHAERIWRLISRKMPRSSDVADVVQETFLAAARSAQRYDPARGSLWNWLSGIARNRVALHYRSQQRQRSFKSNDGDPPAQWQEIIDWLESREASPPDALATSEMAATIRAALTELSIDYEQILTAKYIDGATVRQIATSEACSEEAVRSKLARARKAFRRVFMQTSNYSSDDRAEKI